MPRDAVTLTVASQQEAAGGWEGLRKTEPASVNEVGSRFLRSDHPHLDGHQVLNQWVLLRNH